MDINQDMIDQAAKEEGDHLSRSPVVLVAQNQHLNNRVVLLRALVNQQQEELESIKAELAKLKTKTAVTRRAKGSTS